MFNSPGDCTPRLNFTEEEMIKKIEFFSRKMKPELYDDAIKIHNNLTYRFPKKNIKFPFVHTYELYDKAWSFARVRRYEIVQQNMDMLEHFEDNLNTNPTNVQNLANFIRVATTVRNNLNAKYGDQGGGFLDPYSVDPYKEEKPEFKDFSLDSTTESLS